MPSILIEDSCDSVDENDDSFNQSRAQKKPRTLSDKLHAATKQEFRYTVDSTGRREDDGVNKSRQRRRFECGCWLHLRYQAAGCQEQVMHIRRASFLIGRDPLRVPPEGLLSDPSVSRVHAEIRRCDPLDGMNHIRSSEACIWDHGSSCGTVIDGRGRVPKGEAVPINSGELICFGCCESPQDAQGKRWF